MASTAEGEGSPRRAVPSGEGDERPPAVGGVVMPWEVWCLIAQWLPLETRLAMMLVAKWARRLVLTVPLPVGAGVLHVKVPATDHARLRRTLPGWPLCSCRVVGGLVLADHGRASRDPGAYSPAVCVVGQRIYTYFLGVVRVWDVTTGREVQRLGVPNDNQFAEPHMRAAGGRLYVSSGDRVFAVDMETGEVVMTYTGHTRMVTGMCMQGDVLYTSSIDRSIRAWHTQTGEQLWTAPHRCVVCDVCVTADHVFTACHRTARMFDRATGQQVRVFRGHKNAVRSVWAQGEQLFTGSADGTVKIWNIQAGTLIRTIAAHDDCVHSLCARDRHIFTGSQDRTAKMYDTATGELSHTFTGHTGYIYHALVMGDHLLTSSSDGTVRMWHTPHP